MIGPIETVDYHTAGEPFRIVTSGVETPLGETVLDRRRYAETQLDEVRAFLVNEPRGHADMYGCLVTPPDDSGAAFGLVFFHKDGFSTACGHGTIAAARWALDTGLVTATPPLTEFSIDVPSGRTRVRVDDSSVEFVNVPSWVSALDVEVPAMNVTVDVSYGGAFYASLDASAVALEVTPAHIERLIAVGRRVKWALNDHPSVRHPIDDRLSGCYGTIIHGPLTVADDVLTQTNVTVFADGEVDRSPCGSGTSARLAVLDRRGLLPPGGLLVHRSIVDTTFEGRIIDRFTADGHAAVVTTVRGDAHRTGVHQFFLDPADLLGLGFQLR